MRQRHDDHRTLSYPKIRRWLVAAYRSMQQKPMLHGLITADVTKARTYLREQKTRTGESLSLTAFLIACLAEAVDEDKSVQGIRQGVRRIVIFDDVDVYIPIEYNVMGQKLVYPHIVRAANHKTVREIHDEIRAAKTQDITRQIQGLRFLPPALFGLAVRLFWLYGRARPRTIKQHIGTVGLTSVGMFGNDAGWGIPCPPAAPLMVTVGGIGEKRESVNGQTTLREYLCLTISVDHNIVDGAPAARFTTRLRELIESGYGLGDIATSTRQVVESQRV